jgi:hypothetical protein
MGTGALATNSSGDQNTAFGYQALNLNTTTGNSTGVGYLALSVNTNTSNSALGARSLQQNTTGTSNSGFGALSLYSNTTGSANVAHGADALRNNTTASNNTALGYQAGYSNTVTSDNTFIGFQAGYTSNAASARNGNTAIGSLAGYFLTTGTANTFVGGNNATGFGAGYYVTTGSKNTIIGGYGGNQNSVDIRTLSNYIVLSDGDGYPAFWGLGGASGYMRLQAGRLEFPATQNASSDPNTLDDYEEGSWTPTYVFSGGNGTAAFNTSAATYTKIGNMVLVNLYFNFTKGTASGDFTVTGLPFAANTRSPCAIFWDGGGAASNTLTSEIVTSTIVFNLAPQSTSYATVLNASQMNANPYPRLTCSYRIA